jgi:hypothetical protein
MGRFVLVLILVLMAAALAEALLCDQRRRRAADVDRLRWAFLHGRPLAGLPVAAAREVIVQSDIATLDRDVRAAVFSDPAG